MIKIVNLSKSYIRKGKKFLVLDNINVEFPDVGCVGIVGESGSGKSTLLNMIGALDVIDSGNVFLMM